jgi:hypothetical protein
MADRTAPLVVTPRACPFVALEDDRDRRLDVPDPLHRCFAEPVPRARSISHQAGFCLASTFSSCPIFLDWASRAAAEPVLPRVAMVAAPPDQPSIDDTGGGVATRPIDGSPVAPVTTSFAQSLPEPRADAVPPTGAVPTTGTAPVTGSAPVTPDAPRTPSWMQPPPWMRRSQTQVWVAEAAPPPDVLAELGGAASSGLVAAPRGATGSGPQGRDAPAFGDDTTGMPPDVPFGAPPPFTESGMDVLSASVEPGSLETSAELAASRYRTDILAGADPDDDDGTSSRLPDTAEGEARSRRRVPLDANASTSLGSQARPGARATGSREWEGPRRFEAYAATQRRRPTVLLVGGGAIVLTVMIVGVFLLPGMFLGGAAPTEGPSAEPTSLTAAARPTRDPAATSTPRPERTPRTYRVKSGDTLIRLSRRWNVSVDAIVCLNRIRNPNNLAVGSTLTVPPRDYRCPRATRKP